MLRSVVMPRHTSCSSSSLASGKASLMKMRREVVSYGLPPSSGVSAGSLFSLRDDLLNKENLLGALAVEGGVSGTTVRDGRAAKEFSGTCCSGACREPELIPRLNCLATLVNALETPLLLLRRSSCGLGVLESFTFAWRVNPEPYLVN